MFDITISIATRDNKQQLKECFGSIYQYNKELSIETYVVSDYSTDDIERMVLELFPHPLTVSRERRLKNCKR